MSKDDVHLRTKLDQVEVPEPDVSSIVRRGHQIRRSRRVVAIIGAAATVLVVAIGATTAISALRDSGFPPISGDGDRANVQLAVYLNDGATDAEVQDILDAASGMEGVVSVEHISKARAFAEFKERYRDEPQFWESLPPDALPAAVRIVLADDADAKAIRAELLDYPGVDEIALGRTAGN